MPQRPMQSPKMIIGAGAATAAGAVHLPPGERFQVIHFGVGTIRYRYGNEVSPALYTAVLGAGPIMVHPGTEVFIELLQAADTKAFIHIVGQVIDDPKDLGWKR